MDVLELPRPVINFLRTMAKESCRYALSWDIFGGPDSVTLTLTWKLIDDEAQSSIINDTSSPSSLSSLKKLQNYDNPHTRPRSAAVKENNRSTSPRRSRRDENISMNENISVPAIFRSSRGKSLEGSSAQSTKPIVSHHQQQPPHVKEHQNVSSLERQTITNHQQQQPKQQHHRLKKEQQKQISTQSDQIYGNLYDSRSTPVVKCATISSLSSSSPSPQPNNNNNNNNNNNTPLSVAHTHQHRAKQHQSITPPTVRKPISSLANASRLPAMLTAPTSTSTTTISSSGNISSNSTKLRRNDNLTTHDNTGTSNTASNTTTTITTNNATSANTNANNNCKNKNNNDDDDDGIDPWVKRFECSFEDNDNDDDGDQSTEHSDDKEALSTTTDNVEECGNTSGKVKFKTKPDYF